jgi:hypothetical protein
MAGTELFTNLLPEKSDRSPLEDAVQKQLTPPPLPAMFRKLPAVDEP